MPRASSGRVNQGALPTSADSVRVKLKYFQEVSILSLVSTDAQQFRLNSVYDPDLTGTGRQPNGYDQWSAFYARYRVWGGTWKLEMQNIDDNYNIVVGAVERANDSAVDTNLYDIVQEPRAHFGISGCAGAPKLTMSSSWYNPSLLGVTNTEYQDQDFGSTISANPSIQTYLVCRFKVPDSETLAAQATVYFTIEYDVEFYERVNLDSSLFGLVKLVEEFARTEDPRYIQLLKEDVKKHKENKNQKQLETPSVVPLNSYQQKYRKVEVVKNRNH